MDEIGRNPNINGWKELSGRRFVLHLLVKLLLIPRDAQVDVLGCAELNSPTSKKTAN